MHHIECRLGKYALKKIIVNIPNCRFDMMRYRNPFKFKRVASLENEMSQDEQHEQQ